MDENLLKNTIESMDWMISHFMWSHDQAGIGGDFSPELRKAIDTLSYLKEIQYVNKTQTK